MGGILSGIFGAIGASQGGKTIYKAGTTGQKNIEDQIAKGVTGIQTGEAGLNTAVSGAQAGVNAATATGVQGVNSATTAGQQAVGGAAAQTQPYVGAGQAGISALQDYALSKPTFSFNPGDLQNDPGYQFQLQQGQKAIANQSAATGLNQSGAALKELTQYGQGLAGTYYNDAFNRAKTSFDTNQSATLSNLGALSQFGQQGIGQNIAAQENVSGTGLQGASTAAGLGLQGASTAGGYGVQGGLANLQGQEFAGQLGVSGEEAASKLLLEGAEGKAAGQAAMWNGIGDAAGGLVNSFIPGGSKFAGKF